MNTPTHHTPTLPAVRVEDTSDVRVRLATQNDFAFIDALQKQHSKQVGFLWEAAIRKRIEEGNVLVAEATSGQWPVSSGQEEKGADAADGTSPTGHRALGTGHSAAELLGYVIGTDRYLKRDELGIIYQLAVVPGSRRKLVAAHLLKAKFEDSAYGCRLYCCWCAQDLEANKFWESMGFVPLAFRTGSTRKRVKQEDGKITSGASGGRIHIFWQKRIREGDTTTAYWFPSQTGAGAIREDRLALPIPAGVHWSEVMPVVLPGGEERQGDMKLIGLEGELERLAKARRAVVKKQEDAAKPAVAEKPKRRAPRIVSVEAGGLWFTEPPTREYREKKAKREAEEALLAERAQLDEQIKEAKRALAKVKQKYAPQQAAFARELKDRWLEAVEARPELLEAQAAKYDVRRLVEANPAEFGGVAMGSPSGTENARRLAA